MGDCAWHIVSLNLEEDFFRNVTDWDSQIHSKNSIFRIIEIRKIGNNFTLHNSEKDWD